MNDASTTVFASKMPQPADAKKPYQIWRILDYGVIISV